MSNTETVILPWTTIEPTTPGWYLYKKTSEWVWSLHKLTWGAWQNARNPEWLYAGDKPVPQFEDGYWCGPLAEPGRENA